jgi:single stranded DNA-binding protein
MTMQGTAAGNVGSDGELKHLDGGDVVLNFSVATDHYDSKKKERVTEWVEISMWGKRAEAVAKFITKGTPVVAFGEFSIRRFVHNGEQRAVVSMRATEIKLMGGKRDGQQQSTQQPAQQPGPSTAKAADYPPSWDQNSPNQVTRGL